MKSPFLAEDAFLADVQSVRSAPRGDGATTSLDVWWLGQSGFLVHYQGFFLLLDPYLSDSLTRKYAQTDKPHVRMTERVVEPSRLNFLAAVTSSHNHTDHLDPETLKPLVEVNPGLRMVCPEANRPTVRERSGIPDHSVFGLDVPSAPGKGPDGNLQASTCALAGTPFHFTAIPAAHESLDRDAQGRLIYLGFVVTAGPFRIYHSGDTVLFDGMTDLLRPFQVDLALLPINGRGPERRVAGNLWGREASQLAHDIQARSVVPCHFDMFEFNTATPDEFVAACRDRNQPFQVLGQGQRITLTPAR